MGCSSSKSVEVYSTKAPRPQEKHSEDDAHLVALTSSTYGILRLDSQKRSDETNKELDDPVNQMYQKMMNLDTAGSQLPQSWSEVSNVLSKLKTEAQSKAVLTRPALPSTQLETVDLSKLLEAAEDQSLAAVEQPKPKPGPGHKRDVSIIHTLEEVDKLAESVASPRETDTEEDSDDEFPAYYGTKTFDNNRADKRFSIGSIVQRPKLVEKSNKASKSLSYDAHKRLEQNNGKGAELDSNLFDAEFLESFKEAFAQLSNGVPSTERKATARGNKISQPEPTNLVKAGADEQRQLPGGKVPSSKSSVQQPAERKLVQKKTTGESPSPFQSKLVQPSKVQKSAQSGDSGQKTKLQSNNLAENKAQAEQPAQPVEAEVNGSVQNSMASWQKMVETPSSRMKEMPVFSNKKTAPKKPQALPYDPLLQYQKKCPPDGEHKVVLYLTSLRGIRKTFEDCNTVRSILESFNVEIDERDVSMDGQFRQQLKDLMEKPVPVPRLFIKGRYIGGAEEVVQIHENGTLAKLLEGIPSGNFAKECDGCGGVRFIPCTDCSGSCKAVGGDGSVIKCPECNENGLVRCPICS